MGVVPGVGDDLLLAASGIVLLVTFLMASSMCRRRRPSPAALGQPDPLSKSFKSGRPICRWCLSWEWTNHRKKFFRRSSKEQVGSARFARDAHLFHLSVNIRECLWNVHVNSWTTLSLFILRSCWLVIKHIACPCADHVRMHFALRACWRAGSAQALPSLQFARWIASRFDSLFRRWFFAPFAKACPTLRCVEALSSFAWWQLFSYVNLLVEF